jgi:hypothetical protein
MVVSQISATATELITVTIVASGFGYSRASTAVDRYKLAEMKYIPNLHTDDIWVLFPHNTSNER